MAAPGIPLTVAGGGMTRLRTKGAALKNSLYQLTNGYVTMAQTVKVRPGTFRAEDLSALAAANATKGLTFYKDLFHVFSESMETVPDGYLCNVLTFPATNTTVAPLNVVVTCGTVGGGSENGFDDGAPIGSVLPTTINGNNIRTIVGQSAGSPAPFTFIVRITGAIAQTDLISVSGTDTASQPFTLLGASADFYFVSGGETTWEWTGMPHMQLPQTSTATVTFVGQGSLDTGTTVTPVPLKQIHFAAPFMGFLYVVAEFDVTDSAMLAEFGDTYHFWLQSNGPWTADTVYLPNDIVSPTPDNGLGYQATRLVAPNTVWAPSNQITLNQLIEPTKPNGYMFKAIAVAGASPHTGSVEPTWPTTPNATIQEFGDFSELNTTDISPTATPQTPSSTVTDRYGNPYTQPPDNTTGTAVPTITASTTVSTWKPGVLTNPGAVVRPTTSQGAFIDAIPNGDFENGPDSNWVLSDGDVTIINTGGHAYAGSYYVQFALTMDTDYCTMATAGVIKPGQTVSATGYLNPNNSGANMTMWLNLLFYDVSHTLLQTVKSAPQQGVGYRPTTVGAKAPANAVGVIVQIESSTGTHSINGSFADHISWSLETPAAASPFLFEAIQTNAGVTGTTEPTWPSGSGDTVVDGGVTWEAVGASIITWEALPIMESGDTQPTFPTTVGLAVADGNMSWVCVSRQITDKNCPQTKVVAIGQSKVYAIDEDIIPFCATTNPLDWTTQFDAGYLPFGMQTYGSEPVAVLGLYRSNLVAMNSLGYQMWQIDPDPANMALLDAQPVGSTFPLSMQPVQNDLVFLNARGIRSLGISGASGNVQAGQFGKNLDPLVLASIAAGGEPLGEPVGLFYPGTGQYWLIFGDTVYVQTNNGSGNANSWSMYEFPDPISYWTISDGELYLRAGDLVWHVHEDALYDDIQDASDPSSDSIPFTGEVTWPYLDLGTPGVDKDFEGVNIVCDGTGELAVGYDQSNFALATAPIAFDGDTLPGIGMIPIPMNAPTFQIRLTWDAGQAWEWEMTEIYLTGSRGT